ncbi:hypothetical protein HYY69_05605 [Candidatus Woesearchaeota archaeon]|nr:hypothetical protein [Candidatus Woesearchaeota archaeon]
MKLPSREECEQLFDQYKVPDNIRMHCYKVNEVAIFIAKKLSQKNSILNVDLVDRVSLLHDLFKPFVFELKKDPKFKSNPTKEQILFWKEMKKKYPPSLHETALFSLIFKDKYPDLAAAMALEGKMSSSVDKSHYPLEFQIVHYADWRVFVDEIIPLNDRIDDLFERYKDKHSGLRQDFWEKIKESEFRLERKLFEQLDFSPDELSKVIEKK